MERFAADSINSAKIGNDRNTPGAYADLIVVEGDPLKDISLLAADGRNLRTIVREGIVVKNELK